MDDRLLEPVKGYNEYYRTQFSDNATAYFNELVEKSGIEVEQNRNTVKKYKAELATVEKLTRKVNSQKALKGFLIFLAVAGFLAFVIGIAALVYGYYLAGGILLGVGLALGVSMTVVICVCVNPRIKDSEAERAKHQQKADELLKEAWRQMAPLNALYDSDITRRLIEKTVPLLKIDRNFGMRRYDYLSGKYGFGENRANNRSTIGILTGEILGNPFVVDREIVRVIGTCTYTGSLVIHWTTTSVDSDGNVYTQHHTQTLTATVTKPKPYYHQETRLIYGNEAASQLHFTHEPSHAERKSEDALEKHVKKGTKKLRRLQEEKLKKGENFTEMGNNEFDVLFGALDRDNEVEFRLLFTPLAQKNMLALMKDKENYGDDFRMIKSGCLNFISSEHSARWDMDTNYRRYIKYDVDEARATFVGFNAAYFRSLYFDFAPLLSIPLYQQHKPAEYIYKHDYERNYTSYEAEYAANAVGEAAFKHHLSATQAILKTSLVSKDGASDHVAVTAHSYRIEPRVDFVPVLGGDGDIHSVPVPWDEYIPISNVRTVKIKELDVDDRELERRMAAGTLAAVIAAYGTRAYAHGLLCCLVGADDTSFDSKITDAFNPPKTAPMPTGGGTGKGTPAKTEGKAEPAAHEEVQEGEAQAEDKGAAETPNAESADRETPVAEQAHEAEPQQEDASEGSQATQNAPEEAQPDEAAQSVDDVVLQETDETPLEPVDPEGE